MITVGVLGAGAIGCFVGGRLAHLGYPVTLVGRPRIVGPIAEHGLTLVELDGKVLHVAANALRTSEDIRALADLDVVLVAVKGNDTPTVAAALAPILRADAAVVSLQNGVDNPALLAEKLGRDRVFGGMVAWNVVWHGDDRLARMTSGPILVEKKAGALGERVAALCKALDRDGLAASVAGDFERVLWSKLLFNLNNAINALLGVTLADELADRRCRRLIATAMKEGIAAMRAAGIRPYRLGRMSPEVAQVVLPLPDGIFRPLARSMLKVGDDARSSMYTDLSKGKATEIDHLNGAVVRLGKQHGVPTPLNQRIVDEIKKAELKNAGSPRLSVDDLVRGLSL